MIAMGKEYAAGTLSVDDMKTRKQEFLNKQKTTVHQKPAAAGRHEDTQAGVPEQAEDDNEEDDLEGAAEEGGESETPAGDEVETDEVIDKIAKRPRTVAGFEPNDYNSLSNKLR